MGQDLQSYSIASLHVMTDKQSLPADAFTVGLVYVKPLEMNAITVMLDEEYKSVPLALEDKNEYTLGRIGKHNVAIVGPARGAQGKVAIADIVGSIRRTFRNMTLGLLVGIGGGVPHLPKHDVRLGDVVVGAPEVGPAVVQYDLGQETNSGFKVTRTLNKPPALLLQVVNAVEDKYLRQEEGDDNFFTTHCSRFARFPRLRERYRRPLAPDRLFQASYRHEAGTECNQHMKQYEYVRPDRNPVDDVQIHYSTILSGDRVMKSEVNRDKISGQFNDALCFEMEAAGLMDVFPCLVIRGICDYSDSHKNKDWQEYSAATAAAYARELLLTMAERVVPQLSPPTRLDQGSTTFQGSERASDILPKQDRGFWAASTPRSSRTSEEAERRTSDQQVYQITQGSSQHGSTTVSGGSVFQGNYVGRNGDVF